MAKTSPNGLENGYQLPFERPVIQLQRQILELEAKQEEKGRNYASEIQGLRDQWVSLLRNIYSNLTPWETVLVSRHPNRPLGKDYLDHLVKDFVEIHGDRRFGDDKAIRCGLGHIGTEKVMMVVQHKGRDTKEKIACNFGMPQPEGYRKALRAMKMAEKFRLPVVTLIDTPGAFPGVGSEERGVAEAIARNLLEMSRLKTPIVCVVIGEGGSGGALGIGVGDCIAMMQYAYYSVISPEGCASILWRTGEKAPEAAAALKLTAPTLKELRVIDDIVPEPLGGAHRRPSDASYNLERYLVQTLRKLARKPIDELLQTRYERWRAQGEVIHVSPSEAPGA